MGPLLQSIDHDYLGALEQGMPDYETLLSGNRYEIEMFEPTFQWHFTKPALYKHYFQVFGKQLQTIREIPSGPNRYEYVLSLITAARALFDAIEKAGILLGDDSNGAHLASWATTCNVYASARGWR